MDRSPRLAELVVHLSGCAPLVAIDAVEASSRVGGEPRSVDDALAIVARALCAVRCLDLTEDVDLRESTAVRESTEVPVQ